MTTQSLKPRQDSTQTPPESAAAEPYGPIVLRLAPAVRLTDAQLEELCALNPDIRLELNAQGELELMPPVLGFTGNQESGINRQLGNWAEADGSGLVFSPSTGFTLPNRALRSPDASWVLKTRLAELTDEQKRGFLQICPDFVIELRSSSDRLSVVRRKMDEYIANGARLGWLIDPLELRAHIYRPNTPVETLERPQSLSGAPELPGFTLDLNPIWEPAF